VLPLFGKLVIGKNSKEMDATLGFRVRPLGSGCDPFSHNKLGKLVLPLFGKLVIGKNSKETRLPVYQKVVTRVSFEFLPITSLPKSGNTSFLRVFADYQFTKKW